VRLTAREKFVHERSILQDWFERRATGHGPTPQSLKIGNKRSNLHKLRERIRFVAQKIIQESNSELSIRIDTVIRRSCVGGRDFREVSSSRSLVGTIDIKICEV
jgi:hypothetical protein